MAKLGELPEGVDLGAERLLEVEREGEFLDEEDVALLDLVGGRVGLEQHLLTGVHIRFHAVGKTGSAKDRHGQTKIFLAQIEVEGDLPALGLF